MLDCDHKLEAVMAELAAKGDKGVGDPPRARTKTKQVNTPSFDVRAALYGMLGMDLTQIHGLGPQLALKLVGECGTDLKAWPSAKHFTSWLCLAPGNKISGGKVLSSRTRRSSSRAAALLRLAATTIGQKRHRSRRILSTPVVSRWQGEGRHRHGSQDRRPVLQRVASWHDLQGSRRCAL